MGEGRGSSTNERPTWTQIVQNQWRFSSLNHQQQKVKANKKPTQNEYIISSLASRKLSFGVGNYLQNTSLATGTWEHCRIYIFPSRLTAPPCLPTIAGSSCKFLVSLWINNITSSKSAKRKKYLTFHISHHYPFLHMSLYMETPPFFDGVASTLFPGTAFSWKNSLITSTSRLESLGKQIPPSKFHAPSKYFLLTKKAYIKN